MAPIRQIRPHERRPTINATAIARRFNSKDATLEPFPPARSNNDNITLDTARHSGWAEASHTILTEDDKVVKIFSKKKRGRSEEDSNSDHIRGEPAVYSTDGTLCHSYNELYPRKGARLVSSRPARKAARKSSARQLPTKAAATYWPDAKNSAEIAAFCTSKLKQYNSLNDIESLEAPAKLTIDDLRRMRCTPRSGRNATPLRPRASKTFFNNNDAFMQSFVEASGADYKNMDVDVDTDVDSDIPKTVTMSKKRKMMGSSDNMRRSHSVGNISPFNAGVQSTSRFGSRGKMMNEM